MTQELNEVDNFLLIEKQLKNLAAKVIFAS